MTKLHQISFCFFNKILDLFCSNTNNNNLLFFFFAHHSCSKILTFLRFSMKIRTSLVYFAMLSISTISTIGAIPIASTKTCRIMKKNLISL